MKQKTLNNFCLNLIRYYRLFNTIRISPKTAKCKHAKQKFILSYVYFLFNCKTFSICPLTKCLYVDGTAAMVVIKVSYSKGHADIRCEDIILPHITNSGHLLHGKVVRQLRDWKHGPLHIEHFWDKCSTRVFINNRIFLICNDKQFKDTKAYYSNKPLKIFLII